VSAEKRNRGVSGFAGQLSPIDGIILRGVRRVPCLYTRIRVVPSEKRTPRVRTTGGKRLRKPSLVRNILRPLRSRDHAIVRPTVIGTWWWCSVFIEYVLLSGRRNPCETCPTASPKSIFFKCIVRFSFFSPPSGRTNGMNSVVPTRDEFSSSSSCFLQRPTPKT